MKKFYILIICLLFHHMVGFSQDRVNSDPSTLSMKTKGITEALYWHKDSKKGKWVSNSNTEKPYYGEGVHSENFNSLFIGEFKGNKYLFLDYYKSDWRYPNLRMEWTFYRDIIAGLISEEQINKMKEVKVGETYSFEPEFHFEMFKGDDEYSPSLFLDLTESMRSAQELLKEKPKYMMMLTIKRVISEGHDVIRFKVYPDAIVTELIDDCYFEVKYKDFENLFIPDKKTKFK